VKNPFTRERGPAPREAPPASLAPRARPPRQSRLMSESSIHWGRALAILIGMVGVVVVFLVVLTLLPQPGNGNPLNSLTDLFNTNNNSAASPVAGTAVAGAAQPGGTAPSLSTVGATVVVTGTPMAGFVAVPMTGAPNVRSAPSTNNNPLGNLQPGRQVTVLGRSADKAWLQIVWDNNAKAWVAADLMRFIAGDPTKLPTVSP
jgi:hypothetical protein